MSTAMTADETLDLASKGILTLDQLKAALAAGCSPSACDESQETLLHKCARMGAKDLCEALLSAGAAIDKLDKRGQSAVFSAVEFGRTEVMLMLLDKGCSVDIVRNAGFTLLHMAAYNSHIFTMEALLGELRKKGALAKMVNVADAEKRTPLHTAAFRSQADMVQMLLKADANPKAADVRNNTAVELAQKVGKDDTVDLLEQYGTTPSAHAVANPERRRSSILRNEAAAALAAQNAGA